MCKKDNELTLIENNTISEPTITDGILDVQVAKEYMQKYQEFCEALLVPTDYQVIGDNKYKKKSAWRKLALAFNITDEIVSVDNTYDENGKIISSECVVKATAPNGRSCTGFGKCSVYDKKKKGESPKSFAKKDVDTIRARFSHPEHDIPSTAHTRAKNRAISDVLGLGEVSAEEMSMITIDVPSKPVTPTNTNKTTKNNTPSKTKKPTKQTTPKNDFTTADQDTPIDPKSNCVACVNWIKNRLNKMGKPTTPQEILICAHSLKNSKKISPEMCKRIMQYLEETEGSGEE